MNSVKDRLDEDLKFVFLASKERSIDLAGKGSLEVQDKYIKFIRLEKAKDFIKKQTQLIEEMQSKKDDVLRSASFDMTEIKDKFPAQVSLSSNVHNPSGDLYVNITLPNVKLVNKALVLTGSGLAMLFFGICTLALLSELRFFLALFSALMTYFFAIWFKQTFMEKVLKKQTSSDDGGDLFLRFNLEGLLIANEVGVKPIFYSWEEVQEGKDRDLKLECFRIPLESIRVIVKDFLSISKLTREHSTAKNLLDEKINLLKSLEGENGI